METFAQDIRYALRTLRKNPVFTTVAIVCLTVGIATNTTLFSCFNAIVLKPLPFPNAEQLLYLDDFRARDNGSASVSYLTYTDWRAQSHTLSALGATTSRSIAITEGDEPERLIGQYVSASMFPLLGTAPQIGRMFRDDEDRVGAPGVVIIGDALWRRRYGADSGVLNRVVSINNAAFTVIGVMPPRFRFPSNADLWMPLAPLVATDNRNVRSVGLYGRRQPTAAVGQVRSELATISKRLNDQYAPTSEWVGRARPLRDQFLSGDITLITSTMFGAVTLVLLIACANVANLMLTRAAARQREIAVRAALGAERWRIVRQLLTEAVIIALISGAIAVPLTKIGLRLIDYGIPPEQPLPWFIHWSLDPATLAYTFGIALFTSVIFGLVPALQVSRGRMFEALKEGGGRANLGSARRNKLRSTLVVAEIALSLVLLVGASLFTRDFLTLQNARIGFDTAPILTMRLYLPGHRYDSAAVIAARTEDIVQRVEALPSVAAATVSNFIPMDAGGSGTGVIVEGAHPEPGKEPYLFWTGVSGHWFEALNVHLTSGRTFTPIELAGKTPVAIINPRMATKFWPNGDAVGHRFRMTNDSTTYFEIIGVTPDIRTQHIDDDSGEQPMTAYVPYRFLPARNNGLMVRTKGDPAAAAASVRQAIHASDPTIPVFSERSLDKVRALSFWEYGLFSTMFSVFGAIAMLLAGIGVYGVISYGVSQRTQEIGVRVALGAQRADVFTMVLTEALWLAAIGVALGLGGAFGVTRVLKSILIGISPTDPVSFIGVSFFLAAVALLASYIPARRATRVDPLVALRAD